MFRPVLPHLPRRLPAILSCTRSVETAGPSYPYNSNVVILPPPDMPVTPALLKGKGLMAHLHKTLPSEKATNWINTLFSHRGKDRILPGSILHLTLKRPPFNFSGILIAVRHRGPDTNFVLRNVVHRTGVEMRFFVASDDLQDIKVSLAADGKSARREARAKLFYLRDNPQRMNQISAGARRKEQLAQRAEREKDLTGKKRR